MDTLKGSVEKYDKEVLYILSFPRERFFCRKSYYDGEKNALKVFYENLLKTKLDKQEIMRVYKNLSDF